MEMDVLELRGSWEFKEFPESARRMRDLEAGGWMPATIPSSIYTCLASAEKMDFAELTVNPENFAWISRKSWIFRTTFDIPPSLANKESINLIFEGLDTVSHIWLNDKLIGKTENMFIPHTFDITDRLKPAGNVLYVKFLPALNHAERLMQRYGRLSEHHFGDIRRSYIRKAQYQFGSVLGPALPGCGIFRPVRIEGYNIARIGNLHIRTVDCNQHYADIRIALTLERVKNTQTPLECRLHLTGGGLNITRKLDFSPQEDRHTALIYIERPFLWWPRGYGVQHLYHLKAELYQQEQHLQTVRSDFGVRTLRLNRTPDKAGTKFQFEVNEQPFYAKSANWMPLSPFPGLPTSHHYHLMLELAAHAHINMLRVWAGGYYENSEFYQLCDKLGILVWQDFMFASAYYPDRQWFIDNVAKEAQAVIERLRNHSCLALWCGNSRIDSLHETGRLGTGRKFYGKTIYHELLPGLLSELDPDREYVPTTPFSDTPPDEHSNPASGTAHRWEVWNHEVSNEHNETAIQEPPRFIAEFGFQSLPNIETLAILGVKNAGCTGSQSLEKHNYQPGGQQWMIQCMADYFMPPRSLKDMLWQSQVSQARAAKRYVEYLRSQNSTNAGCLLWTFNESTPSIGFSAVDALGIPKAIYYYARRFFSPILVTLIHDPGSTSYRIVVVNDTPNRITATLDSYLLDFFGKSLDHSRIPVALSPQSRSTPYPLPKSFSQPVHQRTTFVYLSLISDNSTLAENMYFSVPDKYFQMPVGDIDVQITPTDNNTWQVTLNAETLVRDLQLIPPCSAQPSDNFVTLLPGHPATMDIHFKNAAPAVSTPIQILSAVYR